MTSGNRLQHSPYIHETICIVANGSSILKTPKGPRIDEFGVVGRINNYRVRGFENFVGSKTNVWFNGANQNLKSPEQQAESTVVLIPSSILNRKGEAIDNRICRRLKVKSKDYYTLVSKEEILSFEQKVGSQRLTTGTKSILWAIGRFREVYIHGFDFFIDSKTHYNDPPLTKWLITKGLIKKAEKHDMRREKEYITTLLDQGIIRKLD
ncbi:hypothetical protein CHISP_1429 [Chitinispirillum alkaliphilum]|nr:hypothetical protein CHISP_1429 [Chitinispirillum alkaliphilum]